MSIFSLTVTEAGTAKGNRKALGLLGLLGMPEFFSLSRESAAQEPCHTAPTPGSSLDVLCTDPCRSQAGFDLQVG